MFVYILYSEVIHRYYTGQTKNLDERLQYHNEGFGRYTKKGVPWKLVWSTLCSTRSEAMALERKIKKRGAFRYLNDILGV